MTSSRELAETYATYAQAQLSGDEIETIDFGLWLDDHWHQHRLGRHETCLDDLDGAVAAGCAIEWLDDGDDVLGILAGRDLGHYRVRADERPPAIALLIDDVPGCSTGSMRHERAHVSNHLVDVQIVTMTMPEWGHSAPTPNLPRVIPPDDHLGDVLPGAR